MTDHDAILAAAHDRPMDETPRLVLADHLDDVGDHHGAAFHRAFVAHSRLPDDGTWQASSARTKVVRELLQHDGPQIAAYASQFARHWSHSTHVPGDEHFTGYDPREASGAAHNYATWAHQEKNGAHTRTGKLLNHSNAADSHYDAAIEHQNLAGTYQHLTEVSERATGKARPEEVRTMGHHEVGRQLHMFANALHRHLEGQYVNTPSREG